MTKMRLSREKLAEKLKEHRKKPTVSKKQERRLKKKIRKLRQAHVKQHREMMAPMLLQLQDDLDRERIIREVQGGAEETEGA